MTTSVLLRRMLAAGAVVEAAIALLAAFFALREA